MAVDYEGQRRLADHILSSRLFVARHDEIPLDQFWTFVPLRCHWCRQERTPAQVHTRMDGFVCCIDKKRCTANRMREVIPVPEPTPEPVTSTGRRKRVVPKVIEQPQKTMRRKRR